MELHPGPEPRGVFRPSKRPGLVPSGLVALRRCGVLLALFFVDVAVLCFLVTSFSLVTVGIGLLLLPVAIDAVRGLARTHRRLAGEWSGIDVPDPYRLRTGEETVLGEVRSLLTDPATARDVTWALMSLGVGLVMSLLPLALFGYGLWGLMCPILWGPIISHWDHSWYTFFELSGGSTLLAAAGLGLLLLPISLSLAPRVVDVHSLYVEWGLGPTERTRLASRVQQLSRTRWETLDSSAAELRRIERDLHDGAQARLVAMGMTLSAAERLLQSNPGAAAALLEEAKDASAKALSELRDLVRGIHPPVLADRGLLPAIQALAADCPLSVGVMSSGAGRYAPAVESAAYFAVSELLSNAIKHSGAHRMEIDICGTVECLTIRVRDDGHGGANPHGGSGLRGIERRLAAFDGTLTMDSPVGGPTCVDILLPARRLSAAVAPSEPRG
jgi:signal transduction histidine kinase